MKSIITVTVLLLLFSFQTFSQDKSNKRELLERFNIEKLKEIHKSNLDALEGLDDIKSWLLNPKNNLLEQVLKNQQKGFNIIDSKTAIKKTLLEDGSLVMEILFQSWDGSAWVDGAWFTFTYDGNNNMIEEIGQEWNGSAWINSVRFLFTYDGSNKLTELLGHLWDGSAWMEIEKASLMYDGNNNLIEVIEQVWDGSAWVNSSKNTNMYNGNNNLIEELLQLWAGSAWVNSSKSTNTYDGSNNLTEELNQQWDGFDWVNFTMFSYTYDTNNNRIEGFLKMWVGSWLIVQMYSYVYDQNNNLIEWILQGWDGSAWINGSIVSYSYDGNNDLLEVLVQLWDGNNWVILWREIYSYTPTGIEQLEGEVNTYSLSNNYPNPFNPTTKIEYSIPSESFVVLKVYDVLGNEVAALVNEQQQAGVYRADFIANNLPSGIYFARITANEFTQVVKMTLLK